ncbi:hypothetical protein GCM10011331_22120 [Flavimobilis marinus]|uniref:Serine/threonine protein kinase n=1 Tax=Flavimobilis marinus TaxID=285351 RepID=A0A1I2GU87_9MICO|nr:serine/threonine-protein kinase [Flavimobilis marinus]GHG55438.1 hypothetical protein GCM10011331_22120 [Flavimobilis marinus]SFF20387.1 Serine/threonine protein kinase [Flavimobilis marinus]
MERHTKRPGDEVGGYHVVERLGSGAAGTVYRAVDGGGDAVALKLLHRAYAVTDGARARLLREVAALQKVTHPAIARVLDAEADADDAFIVTELVDGPSLEDEVMGGGPLDADDLYELAAQLAEALHAVHDADLLHRDVKPSNILVADNGPVLIDFGIAQGLDDARVTSTGFVMGTPGYLAPEMLDGAEPSAQGDWWGWAASLAYAATGRAPFGVRPLDVVLSRVRAGVVDLDGLGPVTTAALAGALDVDPDQRLGPDEVVTMLRQAAQSGEVSTALLPTPPVVPAAAPAAGTVPLAAPAPVGHGDVGEQAGEQAGEGTAILTTSGTTRMLDVDAGDGTLLLDTHGRPGDPVLGEDAGDGQGEGYPLDYEPRPLDETGYVRPVHRRRPVAILALAVPAVAAATLYPALTAVVVLVLLFLVRTVGVAAEALHDRREDRGVRRSDGWRAAVLLPWHALRALGGLVPSVLVAASAGVVVLGTSWWLLQTNQWVVAPLEGADATAAGTQNAPWVFSAALAVTAALVLLLLWFGPLSRMTRVGARTVLGHVAPGAVGTAFVVIVALALAALFGLWIAVDKPVEWWPFTGPPDLS